MRIPASATLLFAALLCSANLFAGDTEPGLALRQVLGGKPVEPAAVGTHLYLPTGRIISAIDYANPTAPQVTGDSSMQPATGASSAWRSMAVISMRCGIPTATAAA